MQKKTYHIVYTGIFAVLLAICSWISIPGIIPFTLQTFGVFLALLVLGGKQGTGSVIVYLLLGAVGLPVFSNFGAGVGYLFGSTGGYILGFVLMALILWGTETIWGSKPMVQIISLLAGLLVCYAFGTLWFMKVSMDAGNVMKLTAVLWMCVFPFIIPDLCKLWLAYLISKRLKPLLPKN